MSKSDIDHSTIPKLFLLSANSINFDHYNVLVNLLPGWGTLNIWFLNIEEKKDFQQVISFCLISNNKSDIDEQELIELSDYIPGINVYKFIDNP